MWGMQLPGRLKTTTLGDLLGALHRASATGTLELAEFHGRLHQVHLARGSVVAVEIDRASASLAEVLRRMDAADEDTIRRSLLRAMSSRRLHGEVLVRDFRIDAAVVDRALRTQLQLRLAILEQLMDARITFRVTLRPPRGALLDEPLRPAEFLHARGRARDRIHGSPPPERVAPGSRPSSTRLSALRVLGITEGSDVTEIKRAYRALVRAYHPDLHPGADERERRELSVRFAEVAAAYQALVA